MRNMCMYMTLLVSLLSLGYQVKSESMELANKDDNTIIISVPRGSSVEEIEMEEEEALDEFIEDLEIQALDEIGVSSDEDMDIGVETMEKWTKDEKMMENPVLDALVIISKEDKKHNISTYEMNAEFVPENIHDINRDDMMNGRNVPESMALHGNSFRMKTLSDLDTITLSMALGVVCIGILILGSLWFRLQQSHRRYIDSQIEWAASIDAIEAKQGRKHISIV